jgi:hypothetical protein
MLDSELAKNRQAILDRWVEYVISGYPEETAKFLRQQADPFANPVGAGLREGLTELVDGFAEGIETDLLDSALDRVIRVRAVQDFSASAAVGFVFDLKWIVREVLGEKLNRETDMIAELDRRIDRLGLLAFDVYTRCREQVWAIRAAEIRNQSVGILERMEAWRGRRAEQPENAPES